jgi:transcriptional repressor NrdR
MQCPYCLHTDTKVIDKRDAEGLTKRRRECLKCEKRFGSLEKVEWGGLKVVKKDGVKEEFDFEKLKRGVMRSCEKRPVATDKINKMLANIEDKLRKKGKEVNTEFIGDLVSRELRKLDKVAYIRFASVYRDFTEISDFKNEIKELIKR